ncbi:PREDICTED: uncharacterized protein LOC109147361 [Ipomoea nil]|uniref:uncharacterized protein LOC109147361 n=1 Tax=Ipomoea nil TaxID=35883 RepID=UPI0009015C14|nr:PREDICTED: uncharacterized protein LOC109147361 [Ipomoea nil]
MPPRQRARTPETPTNEQLAQNLHQLTQTMQTLKERRVKLATFYFSHEADLWWIHEGPACLEEPGFDWTALKDRMRERFYPAHVRAAMYEEFLHLQQGSSSVVEYHKRFLELARFGRILVPTELAKAEKFVAGLNYEARKALTVSRPSSLKEAYLSAANLYRVQQLQRGSYEFARKRTESGGSSNHGKYRC